MKVGIPIEGGRFLVIGEAGFIGSHVVDQLLAAPADVRDCARANLLAMASDVAIDAFNLGTGVTTSVAQLARLVADVHGRGAPVEHRPERSRPFVRNRVGDPGHATRTLGFRAAIGLADGIRDLSAWRRGEGRGGAGA